MEYPYVVDMLYIDMRLDGVLHYVVLSWLVANVGVESGPNWKHDFVRDEISDFYRFSFRRRVDACRFRLAWG